MSKRPSGDEELLLDQPPSKSVKTITKAPSKDEEDDGLQRIHLMLDWIQTFGGADVSNVEIARSPKGGFGAYSRIEIPADGGIAKIPQQAIMSIGRSKRSRVGRSCQEVFRNGRDSPCDEFLSWLDMVHGRKDPHHFYHPYLAALPTEAPDVPSWTSEPRRGRLRGTNLGTAADLASKELEEQFHRWMPHLAQVHPELFGSMTLSDLVWARGMYYSRRFPTVLLVPDDELNEDRGDDAHSPSTSRQSDRIKDETASSMGIMLPFFDLLNHAPHQPITWAGSKTHVTFSAGPQNIPAGSEIYNNYGPKGNDMLMMMYGFALRNNCHDSYGLHLVKMMTTTNNPGNEDGSPMIMEKIDLGTFQIHRKDSPICPQFPPELWKALNQMFEDEQGGSVSNDGDDYTGDEVTDAHDDIEIGLEVIEVLLETLRQRCGPFQSTMEVDSRLEDDISVYRDGQRVVLEQAIETLQSMIPETEETEDAV